MNAHFYGPAEKVTPSDRATWLGIFGGLGNQMFQYAFGVDCVNRAGIDLRCVDLTRGFDEKRGWQLASFGIMPSSLTRLDSLKISSLRILEVPQRWLPRLGFRGVLTDASLEKAGDADLKRTRLVYGYWQKVEHVQRNLGELRNIFSFDHSLVDEVAEEIRKESASVAIHIRRGDYVSSPSARSVHLVCDEAYYRRAVERIRANIPNSKFWVFSDDVEYVKENYGFLKGASFVENPIKFDPAHDMRRMSLCKHFIISNSTYSWWPAMLSSNQDKVVIAPNKWFVNVPTKQYGICPSDWTFL